MASIPRIKRKRDAEIEPLCDRNAQIVRLNMALFAKRQRKSEAAAMDHDAGTQKTTRPMVETKDWRWLLWDSDVAREAIHPRLGAGWTAVLKEACCVRKSVDKDKVQRLREEGDRGPLRLSLGLESRFAWRIRESKPTSSMLWWCATRRYKRSSKFGAHRLHKVMRGAVARCAKAAKQGNLAKLKYAHEKGFPWNKRTCMEAAYGGHLHVLKYAHENGCRWNGKTCRNAARGGHLDVLKYAHENGCPWGVATYWGAARGGHLDVLKYAHEKGCPWNESTCWGAAQGGHLAVLKYLHENGCPWGQGTCTYAACAGHLDVLKYAREHGCPWDRKMCRSIAKAQRHHNIVEWIDSCRVKRKK